MSRYLHKKFFSIIIFKVCNENIHVSAIVCNKMLLTGMWVHGDVQTMECRSAPKRKELRAKTRMDLLNRALRTKAFHKSSRGQR